MTTLTAHGVLHPEGWIQLLDPTELPTESVDVDVSLTLLKPTGTVPPKKPQTREPGGFWPDESIPAPFDLPREGVARRIKVRQGTGLYLPQNPIFPLAPDETIRESGDVP